MKNILITISITIISLFSFVGDTAYAHQPRLVENETIDVIDPEVSKAYYGELFGMPHVYTIKAIEPFELYVGILMPYSEDSKKDVQAEIRKGDEVLEIIGGINAGWKEMFEFFGQSNYWDGGEYKKMVNAGEYSITVSSTKNDGKYSLAVGNIETFDSKEIMNALNLIPTLKRDFFEESPISFIKSPFGWGYILTMYILAFIFGLLYRLTLKKFAKNPTHKKHQNIGIVDRLIRAAIALSLLILAITTTWNPWLLFFSGFTLFEALFSWCGFYAAIGKNTCPLK
jgi:hypothetical protein